MVNLRRGHTGRYFRTWSFQAARGVYLSPLESQPSTFAMEVPTTRELELEILVRQRDKQASDLKVGFRFWARVA